MLTEKQTPAAPGDADEHNYSLEPLVIFSNFGTALKTTNIPHWAFECLAATTRNQ